MDLSATAGKPVQMMDLSATAGNSAGRLSEPASKPAGATAGRRAQGTGLCPGA